MLIQFIDPDGKTYCFRHATIAALLWGRAIRASAGETTEKGYQCVVCEQERSQSFCEGERDEGGKV